MVLFRLLAATKSQVDPVVISLTSDGVVGREIAALGIPVEQLDVRSSGGYFAAILRLRRRLVELHPQVVQTWMYHADLVGGLAAKTARVAAIAWGIHASVRPRERSSFMYRRGLATAAWLSRLVPDRIVCCSHQAARDHERIGYAPEKLSVIVNGFEEHVADLSKRAELRARLRLPMDTLLVGSVGRNHPDKDYLTFLHAAKRVLSRINAHFLLVGEGLDETNRELTSAVQKLGLGAHVSLVGPTDRVYDVYSALDLVLCSSVAEALPLVLGEAMATGVPVVTTDAGDAADLVGDTSRVVKPRSPRALGDAIARILTLEETERQSLGRRDRDRVISSYGVDQMVQGYLSLYENLAHGD